MTRSLIIATFSKANGAETRTVITPHSTHDAKAIQAALSSRAVEDAMRFPTDGGTPVAARAMEVLVALKSERGRRMRNMISDARARDGLDALEDALRDGAKSDLTMTVRYERA